MKRSSPRLVAGLIFALVLIGSSLLAPLLVAQSKEPLSRSYIVNLNPELPSGALLRSPYFESKLTPGIFTAVPNMSQVADILPSPWLIRVEANGNFLRSSAQVVPAMSLKRLWDPRLARPETDGPVTVMIMMPGNSHEKLNRLINSSSLGLIGDRYSVKAGVPSAIVVDSVDVTPLISRSQLGLARYFLVPGSTNENRLTAAYFSADSNMTPGGQGMISSRKGGNRWRGDLFGIPKLNMLAANANGSNKALQYNSNQYGGTLGGPIRKTGMYAFFDYAGLRQTIGRWLTGYVPSASERMAITSLNIAPLLAAYPKGTQVLSDSTATMIYQGIGNQVDNEDALSVRLDKGFVGTHDTVQHDAMFLRANLDEAMTNVPFSRGDGQLNDQVIRHTRPVGAVLGWNHSFSSRLSHSLHVGYVRGTLETNRKGLLNVPYSIEVTGLTTLAGNQTSYGASNAYSVNDAVSWTYRRQTLSAGAEVRRLDLNLNSSNTGMVDFFSMTDLAADKVSWAGYTEAVPGNTLREFQALGWVQQSWQLRPNLLIVAGLRYEFFNRLHEEHNKGIPFDFATCGEQGFCAAGADFNQVNPLNLDPRASVAWAPGNGPEWLRRNLIFRAGGGIYHANGTLSDQSQPIYNESPSYSLSRSTIPRLSYPITPFLLASPAGIASAHGMSRMRRDLYATQWSASLQGLLPGNTVATASYLGVHGTDLASSTYLNLLDPTTHLRPHAAFAQIHMFDNTNSSTMNALAVLVTRSLPNGIQLTAGYNWAHEIDDGSSGDYGPDAPQNPACPRCERASGDGDSRDSGGLRSVYPIPVGLDRQFHFKNSILNHVTGEWEVLSSYSARSGQPVNISIDRLSSAVPTGYTVRQRPDRVPGISAHPQTGLALNQWLNPAAFNAVQGMYGTTPRNSALGPDQWRLDTSLRRQFALPRHVGLRMRIDVPNILNHATYAQPIADWSTPQFGQIIRSSNSGRAGAGGGRGMFLSFDATY